MDKEFEKALLKEIKSEKYRKHSKKRNFNTVPSEDKKKCEQSGKICYNKKEAEFIVNHPVRARKKVLRYYQCSYCNYFHTTSMRQYEENEKVEEV